MLESGLWLKKGKPMAAMVSVSDLKIEGITPSEEKRGLLAAVGDWEPITYYQ